MRQLAFKDWYPGLECLGDFTLFLCDGGKLLGYDRVLQHDYLPYLATSFLLLDILRTY